MFGVPRLTCHLYRLILTWITPYTWRNGECSGLFQLARCSWICASLTSIHSFLLSKPGIFLGLNFTLIFLHYFWFVIDPEKVFSLDMTLCKLPADFHLASSGNNPRDGMGALMHLLRWIVLPEAPYFIQRLLSRSYCLSNSIHPFLFYTYLSYAGCQNLWTQDGA